MRQPLVVLMLLTLASACWSQAPTHLLTEWLPGEPVVADPFPDFFWRFPGQTACNVQVGRGDATIWQTGRIVTPLSIVEYAGPPLEHDVAYWWRVQAWAGDAESPWSSPVAFRIHPTPLPMVRPHIRTFMNFGGTTEFTVENLDLSFRAEPNAQRPDILALNYSLLATMVIPSPKADLLERFCIDEGLTQSGILEAMFCHFRVDTPVTLHVGAERAQNPRETRTVPGWDPANDRNGDGVVDEAEARDLANPKATARRMEQARIPIYYWGPPRDDFVMNVGHPDYQRFAADVYARAQLEGFDGMYVDTVPPDVPGAGRSADVLEFPRPADAPDQWTRAMQTLFARIKSANPDRPVTANGWRATPFVIDGAQSEGWMNISRGMSQYERILRETADLDRRGKIQMIQYNPAHDPETAEFGVKAPVSRDRDTIFGLATYYLVHGDYTYFGFGGHPYGKVQQIWPKAAAVDIGRPLGPFTVFASSEGQPGAAGANILPNGDFEQDADGDGNPDTWLIAEPVVLDASGPHSGRFSARIDSDSRTINNLSRNLITLKPQTDYTLSCWIRTRDVQGSPGAQVYAHDFAGSSGGEMITVTGTTNWTRYQTTFRTGEDAEGRINFRMYGATGTAWFDDIELAEGVRRAWKVFAREFSGALVLAKPAGGPWDESSATQHELPEPMRPLNADGTLGDAVPSVSLRCGEAAILLKATQ